MIWEMQYTLTDHGHGAKGCADKLPQLPHVLLRPIAVLLSTNLRKGLAFGLAGILLLTPDGLLIRIVQVDQATFITARCLFTALAMLSMNLLFGSIRLPQGNSLWASAAYGVLFGTGSVVFVKSVQTTELSNTLVIISSGPLLAALLAAALLKERVRGYTWVACVLAMLAAVLVFSVTPSEQFTGGADGRQLAVVNVVVMSLSLVLIRKFAGTDIVLGAAFGAGVAGLLYLPEASFAKLEPLVWLQLFVAGFVVQGIAFWLITRSARLLSPPEVSLFFLIELFIAPLLLWLLIGETTALLTIVAGVLMVCAFGLNLYFSLQRERQFQ